MEPADLHWDNSIWRLLLMFSKGLLGASCHDIMTSEEGNVMMPPCVDKVTEAYPSFYYYRVIVALGVHCDICKRSDNILQLNSPSHQCPLLPFPPSWNSFNRSHFSIFIHEYILFPSCSPSYTLSLHPPPPTDANPGQNPACPLVLRFRTHPLIQ
jgi:hypothetical protein